MSAITVQSVAKRNIETAIVRRVARKKDLRIIMIEVMLEFPNLSISEYLQHQRAVLTRMDRNLF